MQKIISLLKTTILTAALILALGASFTAGGYWTGQNMEKSAVAHDCAKYDPKNGNAFNWLLPITMDTAVEESARAAQTAPKVKITR